MIFLSNAIIMRKTILDFQWAFNLNLKSLTALGIWPCDKKGSHLKSLWLGSVVAMILCGQCLPAFYALYLVRHELPLFIDNLLIAVSTSIAALKASLLWYNRLTHNALIERARANYQSRRNADERKLMFKQARRARIITTINYCTIYSHTTLYLLNPMFNLGIRIVNNITDPDPQRTLPIQSYYPYEFSVSPYYELTYLSQVVSLYLATCAMSGNDTYFVALLLHASGQCELLTERAGGLCDQGDRRSFKDRVRDIIDTHTRLARFAADLERSFNITIFCQIFCSVMMICSASYVALMTLDEAPSIVHMVPLIPVALNVNVSIIIYCLPAEILASNSAEIYNGIYNSEWYTLPAKEARHLILMMARAQYPMRVSAGKFFYLSMNAYVQIVKSTAGYISMLLNFS